MQQYINFTDGSVAIHAGTLMSLLWIKSENSSELSAVTS